MKGTLFLFVGNSGSGKDSIIKEVLKDNDSIIAPKRIITREKHESEDCICVGRKEFEVLKNNNRFALHWESYDKLYGIPKEMDDYLEEGKNVLVNVSRDIIKEARERYPNLKVIFIYVPLDTAKKRIVSRNREGNSEIDVRIRRAEEMKEFNDYDYLINNNREISDAAEEVKNIIFSFGNI